MNAFIFACLSSILFLTNFARALDVIMAGGVALKSWENYRAPDKVHDRWWANFIRASTLHMQQLREKNPHAVITWIVYRPSYVTRQAEDGKPYVQWIEEHAVKYKARLVWVSSSSQAVAALNNAPRAGRKIRTFTYYGHSNAHAFMLDYSNSIIGASKAWIHEKDLARLIRRDIFAPGAICYSYGCHTGVSMSRNWYRALGVRLYGNIDKTRYQPLSQGRRPQGVGAWVW